MSLVERKYFIMHQIIAPVTIFIIDLPVDIGINHGFPLINIRKVPREILTPPPPPEGERSQVRCFQHLPRDLANVNE